MTALVLALATSVGGLADEYIERYFRTYPTKATEAGRHDLDHALEDLGPAARRDWASFNRILEGRLATAASGASGDDALDAEVLLAQVRRELHDLDVLRRPERDPLWWTGLIANATVFLLARDDLPRPRAVEAAVVRAEKLPALAAQAREALGTSPPDALAPEQCRLAAAQARAAAAFYRDGLARAAHGSGGPPAERVAAAAVAAAQSLDELGAFLESLAGRASGSARLGARYAATLTVGTGRDVSPDALLARAEAALADKRRETAEYGRSVWPRLMAGQPAPADDRALVRALFARVEADRDPDLETYAAGWSANVRALDAFLRAHDVITLPDPLTLVVDRSPAYFVGQSVGGVFPAGPYAPEAKTILFLPVPPDGATPAARDTFFRAFNRHFNAMIAPHELLPGHYLQLKYAARHPRKVRALFPDPVYVEGWGTFCERLALDLGWGGPLTRLAHLKKQLENVGRAIVDVRVHARGATREEVLAFVRDEALQDEQLAANMWTRAVTTSPQITTYFLGYEEVRALHEELRHARGPGFRLKEFMDGMMALGPVPVRHYRRYFAR